MMATVSAEEITMVLVLTLIHVGKTVGAYVAKTIAENQKDAVPLVVLLVNPYPK